MTGLSTLEQLATITEASLSVRGTVSWQAISNYRVPALEARCRPAPSCISAEVSGLAIGSGRENGRVRFGPRRFVLETLRTFLF